MRATTELYILWSELGRRKLSPTLMAAAHYSSPDNAIGLVAQCELSRYVKLGSFWRHATGRKFSHRPGKPATVGVVRWPSAAGDTAGCLVLFTMYLCTGWLDSRVVSVLDSGAEGPGFKSQSRRCRVTVLGKLFTPTVPLFTKQRN